MPTRCRRFRLAVVLTVAVFHAPAWAQQPGAVPGSPDPQFEETIATAAVAVDGVELLRVRGVAAVPAEQRAAVVAARIVALARNTAFSTADLRVEEAAGASRIMAGQELVLGLYDLDAGFDREARRALAAHALQRIRTAIDTYRADRGWPAMRSASGRAVAALAVLGLALLVVFWLWRRLDVALEVRYRRRVEELTAKSSEVVSAARLWTALRKLLRFVRTATVVALVFVSLQYVLILFPQTRPTGSRLTGYVIAPLERMAASFLDAVPGLMFLAVLTLVVRLLLRILRRSFEAVEEGRLVLAHFDRDWAIPTYKLLRLLVVAFAIVVGYPYIPGSSSDAFKGVSLFLGVVFSLGSSSFLSNMIAGYSMNYRRAFKVGDRVKIGDVAGEVTNIRLQVTHVRTVRNEEITVPNSVILNTHVVNYSALARSRGLILTATVGIGYETPWRQVEAMLVEAARRTPGVLPEPVPFIRQQALGDFCVTYVLCAYTDQPTIMEATSTDLHRNVLDVFNEYGVQIMTPAYERDPETPKIVPRDQWFLAPAKPDVPSGGPVPAGGATAEPRWTR